MDIDPGVRRMIWTSLVCASVTLTTACVVGKELGSPSAEEQDSGVDTEEPSGVAASSGTTDNEGATGVVLPGSDSTSAGVPVEPQCRDSLDCTTGCVFATAPGSSPLDAVTACLLECEPTTVSEAVATFSLFECGSQACIEMGDCDALVPDGGTGTTDGGETAGDTSTIEQDAHCVACLLAVTSGPQDGQPCFEENLACQ